MSKGWLARLRCEVSSPLEHTGRRKHGKASGKEEGCWRAGDEQEQPVDAQRADMRKFTNGTGKCYYPRRIHAAKGFSLSSGLARADTLPGAVLQLP
jgi:hypothetical protein